MMCSQINNIDYNILNCFYKKYMIVSNMLIDWAILFKLAYLQDFRDE